MLNTAIVGLGWWGKTLVRAVQGKGDIQVVTGATGRRALAEDLVTIGKASELSGIPMEELAEAIN
jgi:hypothetical protein